MDEGIGEIVTALEENQMSENTVIVFASDVRDILHIVECCADKKFTHLKPSPSI